MLLPLEDATLFLRLYPALLGFVAGRLGGIEGVHDLAGFHTCSLEAKAKIRAQLYDNLHLLDAYVSENPDGWSGAELEIIATWRRAALRACQSSECQVFQPLVEPEHHRL